MKVFDERSPRSQVLWLFGHSFPLMLLGVAQTESAWSWLCDPRWKFRLDYFAGGIGGIAAGVAGAALAVLCGWRLFKPFSVLKMRHGMASIVTVEIILLFLSSLILDCGVTAAFLFRVSLLLNLAHLATAGRFAAKDSDSSPLANPPPL